MYLLDTVEKSLRPYNPHLTTPNVNKLVHSIYAYISMYGSNFEIKPLRVSLRFFFIIIGPRDYWTYGY